jgi:hypothetical protein
MDGRDLWLAMALEAASALGLFEVILAAVA